MTWVKICGITNLEDARIAIDAGANALGFVFHPASPRNVSAATVKGITASLPARIEKVGVFVSPSTNIEDTVASAGLTAIQLHFTDPPDAPENFLDRHPRNSSPSMPGKHPPQRMSQLTSPVPSMLSSSTLEPPDRPGGTGKVFDWKAAVRRDQLFRPQTQDSSCGQPDSRERGGRNPHLEALGGRRLLRGQKLGPARKIREKVRAFIQAVRHIEVSV